MSLRHLLGPETNSSFFFYHRFIYYQCIEIWFEDILFGIIQIDLKIRTTFIVYSHQENFVKSLEENSFIR